jgi:hypothetical protein
LKKTKPTTNEDKKEEKNPLPSKPVGQPLPVYGKNWTNKPLEQTSTSESTNEKKVTPLLATKSSSKFKFNVDASEFKPNPDAAEFIPVRKVYSYSLGSSECKSSCPGPLFWREAKHNWTFI